MKRGTPDHPKTKRFARLLCGGDIAKACGHLELLWHWTAQFARNGAVGQYDDEEIADGMKWTGDPAELVRCLVESGFVDESPEWRLVVHDWFDHADDSTHMAMARGHEWFADGQSPKVTRLPKDERTRAEKFYAENQPPTQEAHAVHTPCTRRVVALPSQASIQEPTNVGSSPPAEPVPPPPSEFSFPKQSGELWRMPQLAADQYLATYGDRIDIRREFGKARQWLMDHKGRRPKGATGMKQFLTRWLNRADEHRERKRENEPPAANGEAKKYNPETGLWYEVAKGGTR